jgi:hypothetical protein
MMRYLITIILAVILSCSLFIGTVEASWPFGTPDYSKPPVQISFVFDYQKISTIYGKGERGISALDGSELITVFEEKFHPTIEAEGGWAAAPSKERRRGEIVLGMQDMELTGTYKKGYLTGGWTYSYIEKAGEPARPRTFSGSGRIITTEPINNNAGRGYIYGTISMRYWIVTNPSDPAEKWQWEEKEEVQDFQVDWRGTATCPRLCPCDYDKIGQSLDIGASFNSLTGTVEVLHCGANGDLNELDWEPVARLNVKLYAGDIVRTGVESSAILQFADYSTYVMKPETEVVLNEPAEKETKLGLVIGRLWKNTKDLITTGDMRIETSQASGGIKGTAFSISFDGEKTEVKVVEGLVTLTSKYSGKSVDIGPGQMATSDFDTVYDPQPFNSSAEKADWDAVIAKTGKGQISGNKKDDSTAASGSESAPSLNIWYVVTPIIVVIIIASWFVVRMRRKGKKSP